MNFDYIFILTYGRSGSTLLQGILNSIDGVCIRGENRAALSSLARSWRSSVFANGFGDGSDSPAHAWHGAGEINPSAYGRDLAAAFIRNILHPPATAKVTGFKEIRYWTRASDDDVAATIEFARKFFARAAFIVNTREIEATIASNIRVGHNVTADALRLSDAKFRALVAQGDPDVFHVHYDDYAGNPAALQGLFNFLGEPFDLAKIVATMAIRHSDKAKMARRLA